MYIFFSTVQHGDLVTLICIHSFLWHYMSHHKWLDRVPSATQQDSIAIPSQRQHSASIYPKLPVPPTLVTRILFCKSMIFFSVEKFLCAMYYIPDISDTIWYLPFSSWLTSLRMRVSSFMLLHIALFCSFLWLSSIPLCVNTTSS